MRPARLALALAGAALPALAAAALALPQQQGAVNLLNQADGQWVGPGEAQGASETGASLAGLGDIFGDGRSALGIGAPGADPGGRQSAGSVYVTAGQSGVATVDLTALTGRGYRIDGANAGDQLGFALAAVRLPGGDPGLAIGAPYANPDGRAQAGVVYLIDLRRLNRNIELASARPGRAVVGEIIGPAACAQIGYALAAAGLRAGGGHPSLLVGAPGADPTGCPQDKAGGPVGGNTGAAFLIAAADLRSSLDLARARGSVSSFDGGASGDRAGSAVAGAGAGGGFMIGAPNASPLARTGAGAVYLLHTARTGRVVSLAAPPAGSTTFAGPAPDAELGFALTSTVGFGSRPRSGATELALAAPQASPKGRAQAGEILIAPAAREPALVDLAADPRVVVVDGAAAGDEAGYALAAVGDLNGDRLSDLAIGAPFANSQTGQDRIDNGAAYVLFGGSGSRGTDLAHLRSRGLVVLGARNSDEAGTAVAGIANENGDGRPDLLVGAPYAENPLGSTPTVGGAVYAVLGWGTPALRYRTATVTGRVGRRLTVLVPVLRATGSPRFSVSPALPRGLKLSPRTGRISGTPRAATPLGYYTVQMTDLAGIADATLRLIVTR